MKRITIQFYIDEEYYNEYEKIAEDFANSLNENCYIKAEDIAVYEYDDNDDDGIPF